jgi:hypothetical protein
MGVVESMRDNIYEKFGWKEVSIGKSNDNTDNISDDSDNLLNDKKKNIGINMVNKETKSALDAYIDSKRAGKNVKFKQKNIYEQLSELSDSYLQQKLQRFA